MTGTRSGDPARDAGGPRVSPGGVGDGLPSLPSGEPVLHRWFVILMLVLVPAGIAVTVWAFLSIGRESIDVAARRPVGTATVTHDRGDAALNRTTDRVAGPGCAGGITLVGDRGATAAGRRALSATCQLLESGRFPTAQQGLARWAAEDGVLRFAVFERSGVDSSARIDDGHPVIELNARYQFQDATQAAPFVVHELVHLASGGWPGAPVTAAGELAAMQAQAAACGRLAFATQAPRGCVDAETLAAADDPLARLQAAGYRSTGSAGSDG